MNYEFLSEIVKQIEKCNFTDENGSSIEKNKAFISLKQHSVAMEEKKKILLSLVGGSLSNLLYYDRKDCEDLTTEDVSNLIDSGYLTKDDLKNEFIKQIDEIFNS